MVASHEVKYVGTVYVSTQSLKTPRRTHVHARTCARTNMRTHEHAHARTHEYRTLARTLSRMHACTNAHVQPHARTHEYAHARSHARPHARTPARTLARTLACACTACSRVFHSNVSYQTGGVGDWGVTLYSPQTSVDTRGRCGRAAIHVDAGLRLADALSVQAQADADDRRRARAGQCSDC